MSKRVKILIVIVLSIVLGCAYYYCPRSVNFKLVQVVDRNEDGLDYSNCSTFEYAESEDRFWFWLVSRHRSPYSTWKSDVAYDSLFVEQLCERLDFCKYDYIITYEKELKALRYSPYLTKEEDDIDYVKEIPLIPTFDTVITDKVYIYQIRNNHRFRSPGP